MPKRFSETWDLADKSINTFFDEVFNKSNKQELFHFTSFKSFLGMIQNQEIWAFHTNFMNDPTESGLFYSCLSDYVNLKKDEIGDEERDYIDSLSQMISVFSKRDRYNPTETGQFILSLSENKNSVGLWREYAGNGQGLALKLNRENLIESVNFSEYHRPLSCSIYEVKYWENDEISSFVKYFSESYGKIHRETRESLGEGFSAEAFYEAILLNLHSISALIKHKSYNEEAEHRLIIKCNLTLSNIEFIGVENCIRPYIRLPFLNQRHYEKIEGRDRLLEELWLGCNAHPSAEKAIKLLWDTQKAKLRLKIFEFKRTRTRDNASFQTKPIFIKKSDVPIQAK